MKFTLGWLKDHLDTTADVAAVAEAMTMAGLAQQVRAHQLRDLARQHEARVSVRLEKDAQLLHERFMAKLVRGAATVGDALPDGVEPPGNPGIQRVRTHSFGLIWSTMPLACAAMGPVGASFR